MIQQQNLFPQMTLEDLYHEWRQENGEVVKAFFRYADYAAKHGKRFGAKLIAERVRWQCTMKSKGDEYKMNNNWTSLLIRDWKKSRPQWAHLVETRKRKAEV